MLHIDIWQSRQSGISGIACSICVNKAISAIQAILGCKQITWVDSWKDNRNV